MLLRFDKSGHAYTRRDVCSPDVDTDVCHVLFVTQAESHCDDAFVA
jgi:hypothetical protein